MNKILILTIMIVGVLFIAGCSKEVTKDIPPELKQQVPDNEDGMVVDDSVQDTPPENDDSNADPNGEVEKVEGVPKAELVTHNTEFDCWIAYEGQVYDLSEWLPLHPGSAGAISPYCGTFEEFAEAFEDQHAKTKVERLMQEGEPKGNLIE